MKRNRHKYGARRTFFDGAWYDSKAEADRASILAMLLDTGELKRVDRQPRVELGIPENVYRPDFVVVDKKDALWYEDVKGYETSAFKRNKRLWRRYGPAPLHVIHARKAVEIIIPGKEAKA